MESIHSEQLPQKGRTIRKMRNMNRSIAVLFLALGVASFATAQTSSSLSNPNVGSASTQRSPHASKNKEKKLKPFSRVGLGAGVSAMGVNLQIATNMDRHLNLRGVGNVLGYSVNNISTSGFNVSAKLAMATAGFSVDYYPFPTHGLRLSPGMLFYNQNSVTATAVATAGTSFTLNSVTYYSAAANPVQGAASIGFNKQNPAFTLTTGWGNLISRTGSHFSFPFEIGAAFVGTPTLNIGLTQGQVCDAAGANCVNVATDSTVQANLQAQIAKYKNDLNPLQVYPILSFGIGFNFHIR